MAQGRKVENTMLKNLWALTVAVLFFLPGMSRAQTFQVDFSRWTGPPLVKDKFGVYQTPFFFKTHPPAACDMTGLLREAGVRDLRYEMGWGKPDTYAFDQISGTPANLKIDFTRLDPFVTQLIRAGVTPLFAMTYDPMPLKTGSDWQRWKDMPGSLTAWQEINRRYASHYRRLGLGEARYEMWNEPDLPGDGGKVFFNGDAADYARLFAAGAGGIHAGDADAEAGGPAVAWMPEYAQAVLADGPDFASIHGYGNYPAQLAILRGVAQNQPSLLTEYASFSDFGLHKPSSRHPAAALFFRDVRGLLAETDAAKVYWAQWIDNDLGMVTDDLHRKALFNAYKLYQTLLPVDRNPVTPDGENGVGLLAASDPHTAAIVLWNENAADQSVTVDFKNLPFTRGTGQVFRIDAAHASFADDAASENLSATASWRITTQTAWTGRIPALGVVFLRATGMSGRSLLRPVHLGTLAGNHYWYPNREDGGWADFDARAGIARLGTGGRLGSAPLLGSVIDNPAPCWMVQAARQGVFSPRAVNSLFGLRIDYGSTRGGFRRSVLWHDGSYNPARTAVLPWGEKTASVDTRHLEKALVTGAAFPINIAKDAPPDWNHRIILTPILHDMGAHSQARLIFLPSK